MCIHHYHWQPRHHFSSAPCFDFEKSISSSCFESPSLSISALLSKCLNRHAITHCVSSYWLLSIWFKFHYWVHKDKFYTLSISSFLSKCLRLFLQVFITLIWQHYFLHVLNRYYDHGYMCFTLFCQSSKLFV